MNYTILPKKHIIPSINPICHPKTLVPHISHSAIHYYNDVVKQLEKLKDKSPTDLIDYEIVKKITNTYEFLFSTVPGSN